MQRSTPPPRVLGNIDMGGTRERAEIRPLAATWEHLHPKPVSSRPILGITIRNLVVDHGEKSYALWGSKMTDQL